MDFYNEPVSRTHIVNRLEPFDMPYEDGTLVRVVAVLTKEANYWVVTYSILVGLMFVAVTRLAIDLVLAFAPLKDSGNRRVMLVAYYNSPNPMSGAITIANYAWTAVSGSTRNGEKAVNWACIRFALGLIYFSGALLAIDLATRYTVTANSLVVRHATRANPAHIFYLNFLDFNLEHQQISLFSQAKSIRGAANFQALGRFETSRVRLEDRVPITMTPLPTYNGEPMVRFDYSYYLTGFEMGLQYAPKLNYSVTGYCETNYAIISRGPPFDSDLYTYWNSNFTRDGLSPKQEELMPPFVNMVDGNANKTEADGYPFGWTPHTAFRLTDGENVDDPWYVTEKNPDYNASDPAYHFGGKNRVKRGRPALVCRQKDTYSHGGHTVNHVTKLHELPGLKLSLLLRENVFPIEFGSPPIIQLGNGLNFDSLASSLYFAAAGKAFAASKASMKEDFTKLVRLAFLYSREVARNLPLLYSTLDSKDLPNLAAVNGKVPSEYADIILDSPDVAALDLRVLIATPVACLVAWMLVLLRLKASEALCSGRGSLSRMHIFSIGLPATQLYRRVDEQTNKRGADWWSDVLSMTPYVKDIDRDNLKLHGSPEKEALDGVKKKPYVMPVLSMGDVVMRPDPTDGHW